MNVKWVTGELDFSEETIKWASDFGAKLSDSSDKFNPAMTTSQIRKFFGEVKRIHADFEVNKLDVPLLAAKLAYAVGRKPTKKMKEFYDEFLPAISASINSQANYDRFVKLLESTVAFHKFHGGKD
jgi:CRISPR-associated protein Csm2